MTADNAASVKPRCDYRWPLLEPNEEDRRLGNTHRCWCNEGHRGDHECHCGERTCE